MISSSNATSKSPAVGARSFWAASSIPMPAAIVMMIGALSICHYRRPLGQFVEQALYSSMVHSIAVIDWISNRLEAKARHSLARTCDRFSLVAENYKYPILVSLVQIG